MRDYKNIDRIFQENLKDLEVFPPNKSWNSIEKKLGPTSKRRHIPIWVKISSAAAFLLLFFSIGAIYLIPSNKISSKFFIDKFLYIGSESKKNYIYFGVSEKDLIHTPYCVDNDKFQKINSDLNKNPVSPVIPCPPCKPCNPCPP